VPGKKVVEICEFGDAVIERQCAAMFKSKKVSKGVAFPTCVSVNEVVCHYSPYSSESIELSAGDTVKMCVKLLALFTRLHYFHFAACKQRAHLSVFDTNSLFL
jgi:hypothetical protein